MQCTLLWDVFDAQYVVRVHEKQINCFDDSITFQSLAHPPATLHPPKVRPSLASSAPEDVHLGSELKVSLSDRTWSAGARAVQFRLF